MNIFYFFARGYITNDNFLINEMILISLFLSHGMFWDLTQNTLKAQKASCFALAGLRSINVYIAVTRFLREITLHSTHYTLNSNASRQRCVSCKWRS